MLPQDENEPAGFVSTKKRTLRKPLTFDNSKNTKNLINDSGSLEDQKMGLSTVMSYPTDPPKNGQNEGFRNCPSEMLIDGREPNNWRQHLQALALESRSLQKDRKERFKAAIADLAVVTKNNPRAIRNVTHLAGFTLSDKDIGQIRDMIKALKKQRRSKHM